VSTSAFSKWSTLVGIVWFGLSSLKFFLNPRSSYWLLVTSLIPFAKVRVRPNPFEPGSTDMAVTFELSVSIGL